MAGVKKRGQRTPEAKRRTLDLYELVPPYLRPSSRAWKHFQAAKIEFCEGLRVALEEAVDAMRREVRRREDTSLTRIRVRG